jgi:probable extracellular repeat, HAF family/probable extracellular repeat, HAF family/probable extracellular repeat, HAF family/probable extracellular repeat, HAF family
MKRALCIFSLSILLVAGSVVAQTYTITDLRTLGGPFSQANGIGSMGQIVGYSANASNSIVCGSPNCQYHAFLYSGGAMHDLGTFGGTQSIAEAMNGSSQITGYFYRNGFRAFLWTNGTVTDLGNLGASYAVASAINNAGQVVGDSKTAKFDDHAFLYSQGMMRDLGTLGGHDSYARGINDRGQITGYAYDARGAFLAFLWQNGTMTSIGTLGGDYSKGLAINANSQIVGQAYTPGNIGAHAFLYSGGRMTDLEGLGNNYSSAMAINSSGTQIVGNSGNSAFLYTNGQMLNLNLLIPPGTGWSLYAGVAVDDTGLIAGYGILNGTSHAFLLTPSKTPDGPPLVITAPPNVALPASGPSCNAFVSDATLGHATATDNCHCVTITRNGVPSGNLFPLGTTIVTYTASDGHGNTASATQRVSITDSVPPVIGANPPITATAGAGCVASLSITPPTVTDNCGSATVNGVRSDAQPLGAPYPLGATTITWTATDGNSNTATARQTVSVSAPPPVLGGASASPNVLWPPNHKMTNVTVNYTVTGGCSSTNCTISSITSNEPVNGTGDGDASPDWTLVDNHHLQLRAERSGTGSGRVYTITITCSDSFGHATTKNVLVTVPLNQK